MADTIEIEGRMIKLSRTNKILFPSDAFTKKDLIDYYTAISQRMLPYLAGRPLTLHRYPEGINKPGFYQQGISGYFPDWIERIALKKEGGTVIHILCRDAATLVYLANQACITPHIWLSKAARPNFPDLMIFDFDPPDDDFTTVRLAAKSFRTFLVELDLKPYLKTTGSRGLHVVIPLDGRSPFEEVRDLSRKIAFLFSLRQSDITIEQRKDKREGKIFLDYMRNSYGQTAVAPYAVRARSGAPVAVPIPWEFLDDAQLRSNKYNIKNVFSFLANTADPWQYIENEAASAGETGKKLEELMAVRR